MAWYKIYAGLSNSRYQGTYEFDNESQAYDTAYSFAVEEYESYGRLHGLPDYDDCRQSAIDDLIKDGNDSPDQEDIDALADEYYEEELEKWIEYSAKPATGPEDTNDTEEE